MNIAVIVTNQTDSRFIRPIYIKEGSDRSI